MKHLGLFEGIGGFSLAARWMNWHTVAWCEKDEFCQRVLKHHFPEAAAHSDITTTDFTPYHGTIDIITGGFPCQPYSTAGKQKGIEDERHLWPEMLRAIREVAPTWVIGENVSGIINWNEGMVFDQVQSDLEACGYEVIPFVVPACGVNAPHKRDRVWFVAYSANARLKSLQQRRENGIHRFEITTDSTSIGPQESRQYRLPKEKAFAPAARIIKTQNATNTFCQRWLQGNEGTKPTKSARNIPNWRDFPTQSPVCNGDDGLSTRLDSLSFPKWRAESIKCGGNAIVPQVAYQFFLSIDEFIKQHP